MKIRFFANFILCIISLQVFSQKESPDSTKSRIVLEPYYKNVIKWNPTAMVLFEDVANLTLSYERLIKFNHSVAIQAGYLTFPAIFNDTVANLVHFTDDYKQQGVNLGFDYRYYPSIRNRRPAPDGLYVGGYASYYGFRYDNNFDILGTANNQKGDINGTFNAVNLGFDLGYQFVFWKRFTVDLLLFGPALAYYSGSLNFSGNLNQETIDKLDDELVQKLEDRFPLIKSIASGEDLRFTGSKAKLGIGLRYSIQLGFHF